MNTFRDAEDRQWFIAINVDAIKRVKAIGVDLLDVGGEVFQQLAGDPVLLCDVLWVLCKSQAGENGLTDEQFGRGLAGDALDRATEALLEELISFFPSSRRHLMEKALAKTMELQGKAMEHAEKLIDSGRFDRALEKNLRKVDEEVELRLASSGIAFGNAPASSG